MKRLLRPTVSNNSLHPAFCLGASSQIKVSNGSPTICPIVIRGFNRRIGILKNDLQVTTLFAQLAIRQVCQILIAKYD
jgi:hypothetical protein